MLYPTIEILPHPYNKTKMSFASRNPSSNAPFLHPTEMKMVKDPYSTKINSEIYLRKHESLIKKCISEIPISSLVTELSRNASPEYALLDQSKNRLKQHEIEPT